MTVPRHRLVPASIVAVAVSGVCLTGCVTAPGTSSTTGSVTESDDRNSDHEDSVRFVMANDGYLDAGQAEEVVRSWESAGHGHSGPLDEVLTVAPPSGRDVPEYGSISGTFGSSAEDDAGSCVHVLWSGEPGQGRMLVYVEESQSA